MFRDKVEKPHKNPTAAYFSYLCSNNSMKGSIWSFQCLITFTDDSVAVRFSHFLLVKILLETLLFSKKQPISGWHLLSVWNNTWISCEESPTFFKMYKKTSSFNYYSLCTFKVFKKTKSIANMPTFIVEVGYSSWNCFSKTHSKSWSTCVLLIKLTS